MAEIINEIPDEVDMEGEELEVDLDAGKKESDGKKSTADVERVAEPELEIEEEDDTPPEDRGKEPLPDEIVKEVEEDTLEGYSERVKQRMAQLKKMHHDERREKERAERERQEAVAYAQKVANQNKYLQTTLSTGEEDYIKTKVSASEAELKMAKRDYREAYESGDTEKIIEAQTAMNTAQFKLAQASGLKPQYAGQTKENEVESNQQTVQPTVSKPDAKAQAWQQKNTWFGKDEEMTSLALGVHEKLVRSGVSPTSDEYYHRIDETMQKRFPENFGEESLESDKPAQRKKPSNVVAPATRSTAPKKVRLSKTQVAFAKKLKLTPEQYAREMIKLENANG